jgi:hypothetical protein
MSRFSTLTAATLLLVAAACDRSPSGPAVVPAETFVGTWRSISPQQEHLRLTVTSLSSLPGGLAARLTFSGVAWEGPARIDADSLVMDMTSSSQSGAAVIAHAQADGSLRVRAGSDLTAPLILTFVRGE